MVGRLLTKRRPITASSAVRSSSGMTAKGSCTDCRMLMYWLSESSCGAGREQGGQQIRNG